MLHGSGAADAGFNADGSSDRGGEIVVQHPGTAVGHDVQRSLDRKRRDRHAAGHGFQHDESQGVGARRKHEHVGCPVAADQIVAVAGTQEPGVGVSLCKLLPLRPVADDHLGARRVQGEKVLETLLHGNAPDVHLHRPRQVERLRRPGGEQLRVHAAHPADQVVEALIAEHVAQPGRGVHGLGGGSMEAAHGGKRP